MFSEIVCSDRLDEASDLGFCALPAKVWTHMASRARLASIVHLVAYLFSVLPILLVSSSAAAMSPFIFKHIIVMVQENRTPDNLFGSNPTFEPGVDLATSGINSKGRTIPLTPTPLAYCYDPNHDHTSFVSQYDDGRMDGADLVPVARLAGCNVPPNPQFKYVGNSGGIVQPYFDIARRYGWANRMFSSQQGPTFPGHQFIFAGTSAPERDSDLFVSTDPAPTPSAGCLSPPQVTAKLVDPSGNEDTYPPIFPCIEHPTLSDRLNGRSISWKYYAPLVGGIANPANAIDHICEPETVKGKLRCTGPDWVDGRISIPQTNIITDIQNCQLPTVSWLIPTAAASDHPTKGALGPSWVASIINEIGESPACPNTGEVYWQDTAILVTWDDWGGWYDHVPPNRIGESNGWGTGFVYGFRVPLLVISAYTPRGYVDNNDHDFGSILRFIEYNEKLPFVGPGFYADSYADTLEEFFSLRTPRQFVPIAAAKQASDFLLHPLPLADPDDE